MATQKGIFTSLHVKRPDMLKRIKRAAKLRNESVSKFLLEAGDKEAAKVLGGDCPSCGAPIKKHKKAA